MIKGENIYDILGVDQNADKRTIKQAYANLVKQYHPEEQPEEWKRIHDAYEMAMSNIAKPEQWQPPYERTETAEQWQSPYEQAGTAEQWQSPYEQTGATEQWQSPYEQTETAEQWQSPYEQAGAAEQWQSPYEQMQEQERYRSPDQPIDLYESAHGMDAKMLETWETEPEDIFENVETVAHRQNEEEEKAEKEKLEAVIHQMHSLVWQNNFKKKEWKKFFEQKDVLPFISRKEFLRELGDSFFLKQINSDLYNYLDEQLNTIADYVKTYSTEQSGKRDIASVEYARHKVKVAYQSKKGGGGQKSKGISWAAILTINVVLTVFLRYMVTMDNQQREQDRKEHQQQMQEMTVQQNEMIKQQLSETQELISENPEMEEQILKRVQEMLEDGTITQEYYDAYLKYFGIDQTDTDQ